MKVDIAYAENHLSDLIAAATRGELVEIDAPGAHVHLSASPKLSANCSVVEGVAPRQSRAHLFGAWEGLVTVPSHEE